MVLLRAPCCRRPDLRCTVERLLAALAAEGVRDPSRLLLIAAALVELRRERPSRRPFLDLAWSARAQALKLEGIDEP